MKLIQTRTLIRTLAVIILTAMPVAQNALEITLPWHPWASYGVSADPYGHVTAVSPPAAKLGVRVGDRIARDRMPVSDRHTINAVSVGFAGSSIRVPFTSGKVVTLIARPVPRTLLDNVTDVLACLGIIFYILLAATLLLMRPGPVTWAFYIFSFATCFGGTIWVEYIPGALLGLLPLMGVLSPIGLAALVAFALRFPDNVLSAGARAAERVFLFAITPMAAALVVATALSSAAGAIDTAATLQRAASVLNSLTLASVIVILIARYVTAQAFERNRLQWMFGALAVAFVPINFVQFSQFALGHRMTNSTVNIAVMFEALAPIALAYTVRKHRLYDIRLIVSRALVYGVLTSVTVALLALVDWAFGRWLAESRFAILGELALAVGIGIVLTTAHRRIEAILNNLVFRAQTLALHALRRFTHEIDLIPDPQRLLMQTYDALRVRLECEYVAIFAADGASFVAATPHNDSVPTLLPTDDFAVLRLRRWSEPFECDEPEHPLRGALLLPMTARTQLIGFIACGPKRDRTHYLPEEIETLAALAHRAGSAYGWMTMRQPLAPMEAPA